MNHNNIYSILDKLAALAPKEPPKTEAPSLKEYAEVPARGSIVAGVKTIEETLAEKYMGFKKTVAAIKKGGSAEDPEAVAAAIGREKYGKKKFQKAAAAGKKLGEESIEESGLQYYTDKKYGKDGMAALAKAGREGANQEELGRIKDKFIKKESAGMCAECGMAEGSCGHTKMEEGKCAKCGMTDCQCDHAKTEEKTTHKGGEVTHKDGVTKHTKKDYPGYQSDSDDEDDDDEPKKAGRPRKHAKKADTGEKKGRGRPKKEKAPEYDKRHDPFGRVKAGAEKAGKDIKGHKHHMDEKAKSVAQQRFMGMVHAAQKGDEPASPEVAKVAHSMGKKDARDFAATKHKGLPQHVSESINFKRMMEEQHMTLDEMLECMSTDMKMFKETGVCSDRLRDMMEVYAHAKKQLADEGIELPPKVGQDLITPQQRVAQATPPQLGIMSKVKDTLGGIKDFVTGKPEDPTRPTLEDPSLEEELNELARLAGLGEVSRGEYIKQQDAKAEKSGKDKFSAFGQTFDTDEISEEPNEGNLFTKGLEDDDVKIGDKIPGTDAIKTKDIDTEDIEEAKVDVKDAPEAVNKPKPKYHNLKSILDRGDDLNKKKQQYADKPKLGDNPMATESAMSLAEELAAEYESIKKISK